MLGKAPKFKLAAKNAQPPSFPPHVLATPCANIIVGKSDESNRSAPGTIPRPARCKRVNIVVHAHFEEHRDFTARQRVQARSHHVKSRPTHLTSREDNTVQLDFSFGLAHYSYFRIGQALLLSGTCLECPRNYLDMVKKSPELAFNEYMQEIGSSSNLRKDIAIMY